MVPGTIFRFGPVLYVELYGALFQKEKLIYAGPQTIEKVKTTVCGLNTVTEVGPHLARVVTPGTHHPPLDGPA